MEWRRSFNAEAARLNLEELTRAGSPDDTVTQEIGYAEPAELIRIAAHMPSMEITEVPAEAPQPRTVRKSRRATPRVGRRQQAWGETTPAEDGTWDNNG